MTTVFAIIAITLVLGALIAVIQAYRKDRRYINGTRSRSDSGSSWFFFGDSGGSSSSSCDSGWSGGDGGGGGGDCGGGGGGD